MTNGTDETSHGSLQRRLSGSLSRSQLLKVVGMGAAAAALPAVASAQSITVGTGAGTPAAGTMSYPFYPQVSGTYTPETIPTILNIAQTMEYLATTLVNAAVTRAATMGITGLALGALQAALVEEVDHVQFLAAMGATPLTTTFTVPDPAILTNAVTFFRALEMLETICNAAYLTANREFAELGQPLLAKFAYQAGSVEAEHRVAARTALALLAAGTTGGTAGVGTTPTGTGAAAAGLAGTAATAATGAASAAAIGAGATPWTGAPGTMAPMVAPPIPPNNKGFETDYFLYLADAAALVKALGFIGGTGTALTFPGASTALANAGAVVGAVLQQFPNNATVSITPAGVASGFSAMGVSGIIVAPKP